MPFFPPDDSSLWTVRNAEGYLTHYATGSVSWGVRAHARLLTRADLVEAILIVTAVGHDVTFTIERAE